MLRIPADPSEGPSARSTTVELSTAPTLSHCSPRGDVHDPVAAHPGGAVRVAAHRLGAGVALLDDRRLVVDEVGIQRLVIGF